MEESTLIRFGKRLNAELEQHYRKMDQDQVSKQEAVLKMTTQTTPKNTEQLLVQTAPGRIGTLADQDCRSNSWASALADHLRYCCEVGPGHPRFPWKLPLGVLEGRIILTLRFIFSRPSSTLGIAISY